MLTTLLSQQGAAGSYTLVAEGAVYSYSGNNADLVYTPVGGFTLVADGATYSYSGDNANLLLGRVLVADGVTYGYTGNNANFPYNRVIRPIGATYVYFGNNATLIYSGGPPPVIEVIGVSGPQVNQAFPFDGVTEPPFPVQRRTS